MTVTAIRQRSTFRFSAPELVFGDADSEFDDDEANQRSRGPRPRSKTPATDVYAFGMLMLQVSLASRARPLSTSNFLMRTSGLLWRRALARLQTTRDLHSCYARDNAYIAEDSPSHIHERLPTALSRMLGVRSGRSSYHGGRPPQTIPGARCPVASTSSNGTLSLLRMTCAETTIEGQVSLHRDRRRSGNSTCLSENGDSEEFVFQGGVVGEAFSCSIRVQSH